MTHILDAADLVDEVDGDRLWDHLTAFSKWTKLAGTPGERESLAYIEAALKDYGYATELIDHDAYISLPGAASIEFDDERIACITQSFSRPSPEGGLAAPVVDAGAGGESDFAGIDARGRIVLVDGIATPGAAVRARRAGAVGEIHISPQEHVHEMCISPIWGNPGLANRDDLPATVVVTVPRSLGQRLRDAVAAGSPRIVLHAEVDTGWRSIPLLTAKLDRADAPDDDPYVMFSGHHDTWYYGVMDNGGANATMLEVARLIIKHRAQMRRGLRIHFWSGHSQGRYAGSAWYADHHHDEIARRAVAHVNIDSTGAQGNTVLADVQSGAELKGVAAAAIAAESGQRLTGFRIARAGDQSFWGIGVPAVLSSLGEQPADGGKPIAGFLFSGANKQGSGLGWWWHTPEDTLDKMDRELAVRDTRIYLRVVWRLLCETVLPLDYGAYGAQLEAVLDGLDGDLGGRFDIGRARQLADQLVSAAADFAKVAGNAQNDAAAGAVNICLMAVSRNLVRLDYTEGDPFAHDPALPQNPFPALDGLRALAATAPGSDEEKFARVDAVRGYVRLCRGLEAAIGEFNACIEGPLFGGRTHAA